MSYKLDTRRLQIPLRIWSCVIAPSVIDICPWIGAAPPVTVPCSGLNILYKILLPIESSLFKNTPRNGAITSVVIVVPPISLRILTKVLYAANSSQGTKA